MEQTYVIYVNYLEYVLFIFGFMFLIMGTFILVFSQQRKRWMEEDHLFYFIIFTYILGASVWADLLMMTFMNIPFFTDIHFVVYLLAYLFLYELGRRLVFYKKKDPTVILYMIPFLFFFFETPLPILSSYLAIAGSFLSGIGLKKRLNHLPKKSGHVKNISQKMIPYFFFLLSVIYLVFLFHLIFYQHIYHTTLFHWLKHLLEWSAVFLIASLLLKQILQVEIPDPLELQLKHIKISIIKRILYLLAVLSIVGFFFVDYLGEMQWERDKAAMMGKISGIDFPMDLADHQLLFTEGNTIDKQMMKEKIRHQLQAIVYERPHIKNTFLLFIQNEQVIYGIDALEKFNKTNDQFGDTYHEVNASLLQNVKEKGTTEISNQLFRRNGQNLIKAFVPIQGQDGRVTAIVGLDIVANESMYHVVLVQLIARMLILFLFLGIIGMGSAYYLFKRENTWRSNHTKILSEIGDMVGVFDKTGKIIFANKTAYQLSKFPVQVIEDNVYVMDYLIEADHKRFEKLLQNLKREEVQYAEFTVKTLEGKEIPIYVSISYLKWDREDPLYVFTGMNITEQRKREKVMKEHLENTLSLLATVIDAKDDYTAKHSSNVSKYAKGIAEELGFSTEKIEEIERASLVHDIGKIAIPDHILKKEGKLTEEEWIIMRRHSEYGKNILEKAGITFQQLIPYVYYHHERYDGKGYPTNMKEPPMEISIIAVADAFDAMTSDRAYRKGMGIEKAKEELKRHAGTQFHPKVVEALLKRIADVQSVDEIK